VFRVWRINHFLKLKLSPSHVSGKLFYSLPSTAPLLWFPDLEFWDLFFSTEDLLS